MAYQAEAGGYDVTVTRDERSVANAGRRRTFRYQLQGPNALKVIDRTADGEIPRIKFFNIGEFTVAGHPVRALNHTMVGVPGVEHTGLEMWGPAEHGDDVLAALMTAGEEFGLRQGGARAYGTTALESGWIAAQMPAICPGGGEHPAEASVVQLRGVAAGRYRPPHPGIQRPCTDQLQEDGRYRPSRARRRWPQPGLPFGRASRVRSPVLFTRTGIWI